MFGSLGVVVNNAEHGHFGKIEEVTEQEVRDQMETNASKCAVGAFTELLTAEVKQFGTQATAVEPRSLLHPLGRRIGTHLRADPCLRRASAEARAERATDTPSRWQLSSSNSWTLPSRHSDLLRQHALPIARDDYESRLATWENWNALSVGARGRNA
jgi:NAD(P)-dependent dehydrogenase (short-subunit alcohol dehydrogenase family)